MAVPPGLSAAMPIIWGRPGRVNFMAGNLPLLPRLEEVVLVGRNAQLIETWLLRTTHYRVSKTFHPSNRALNSRPGMREEVLRTFRSVARRLAGTLLAARWPLPLAPKLLQLLERPGPVVAK